MGRVSSQCIGKGRIQGGYFLGDSWFDPTLDVQFFPTFSGAANGESGIGQFLISMFPVSPNDSRCFRNRRMKTKDVKILF